MNVIAVCEIRNQHISCRDTVDTQLSFALRPDYPICKHIAAWSSLAYIRVILGSLLLDRSSVTRLHCFVLGPEVLCRVAVCAAEQQLLLLPQTIGGSSLCPSTRTLVQSSAESVSQVPSVNICSCEPSGGVRREHAGATNSHRTLVVYAGLGAASTRTAEFLSCQSNCVCM